MKARIGSVRRPFFFLVLGLSFLLISTAAFASEGNIDTSNKYSWSENAGWQNFRPTSAGVTITATYLSGYLWCENIGWVRMGAAASPPGGASQWLNTTAANYGVNATNDGAGGLTLSGYGWSENAGWINFAPTGAGINAAKVNLTTGSFSGYAWAENVGWVKLAGTALNSDTYKVQTTLTYSKIRVETAANGSGTVVSTQDLVSGAAITGYAIARDASDNFVANVAADSWSLPTKTGGVVDGDLVAAPDLKSAVFTGAVAGTGVIRAVKAGLASTDSGTITVTAGAATKILVETAANGSGTVVPLQSIASGATVTGYSISRDASDNFVANVAADSWSLPTKTGGVVDGDLVAAPDLKSAVFTGAVAGTGVIRAVKAGLASTDSGTITVTAVPPVVTGTVYTQADRKLSITFDKTINVATFTAANLANLSIQDGTTTVALSGATIITVANSTLMEATLTVAEDNALAAMPDKLILKLVVGASCGIKDLAANELATNTDYATSTYAVTYTAAAGTPITGILKDAKSGLVIADAVVNLYDSAGNLRGTATSDVNGAFAFNVNIPSGDYTLNIDKAPLFQPKVQAITVTAGTALAAGDVLIDPFGIVFDAVTGAPIAGANVTLYTAGGAIYGGSPQPNPQSSRADGGYNFDVAPGWYYLGAVADGYANYVGANFVVVADVVEWNIPMIPNGQSSSSLLSILHQANKKVVTAGDIITYTIRVTNRSSAAAATGTNVTAGLPHGFKYVPGSTVIDNAKAADPTGTTAVSWNLGTIPASASRTITYRVRVGPDAKIGNSKNGASVSALVGAVSSSAGPSIAAVEVREGLFSDRGMLMGKVFEDKNSNGVQDKGEEGIAHASLVLEDGTVIVTDEFGRYSLQNVKKGNHVIRLDQRVSYGGPFAPGRRQDLLKQEKEAALRAEEEKAGGMFTRQDTNTSFSDHFDQTQDPSATQGSSSGSLLSQNPSAQGGMTNVFGSTAQQNPMMTTGGTGQFFPPNSGDHEALISRRQMDDWRRKTLGQKPLAGASGMLFRRGGQKAVDQWTVTQEDLAESGADPKFLYKDLVAAGYLDQNGLIQDKFLKLKDSAGMSLPPAYKRQQEKIFSVLKKRAEVAAASTAWRTPRGELLDRYGNPEMEEGAAPRSEYRSDIPKESKFFKLYGSETVKVNFPVQLLTGEAAAKEAEKDKKPNQFMLVGLADGTMGYLNGKGNISNLDAAVNRPYEDHLYKDGSIKLYFKGLVKGEYLATAQVDTDKEKDELHMFEYVNPEKYYPVYGDSSSSFNEADTRGKFYARIDKDDSYGLWGNYNTQEFTQNQLTRYNRTLAGPKAHIELKDWMSEKAQKILKPTLDLFYSPSTQEQVSETFAANGISGPFWLARTPMVEYTDAIRIETRDQSRSDIILHTVALVRDVDYEIDYDRGRIFFKEPVSSRDENDDLNYIVVDYEYAPLTSDKNNYLAGGRLQSTFFNDKLALGGQFTGENHVANRPRLFGTDFEFQPDPTTRLAGEWAYSRNYLDDAGAPLQAGDAWQVEGSKILGDLRVQGYYADIGKYFRNPVNMTEKGARKIGATADYQFTDSTSAVLDFWRNDSTLTKTYTFANTLNLYHQKENYFLGAGVGLQAYRDTQHMTPDETTATATLEGGYKLNDRLVASLQQQLTKIDQDKVAADHAKFGSVTTGRVDYKLSEDATVYVKDRFTNEYSNRYENICSLGFSRRMQDGDAYVEYGFGGRNPETVFGHRKEIDLTESLTLSSYMNRRVSRDRNEENTGYGSRYEITEGLFTTFNIENTRAKDGDANHYDQNSQSIALDYLPEGTKNSYGLKFERRKSGSERDMNFLAYAKHLLTEEFTILFNGENLAERSLGNTERTNRRAVAGLAYRPVTNDKFNALGKYEYKDEQNFTTQTAATDYAAQTVSLEGTYELSAKIDLFGKYALKFLREDNNDLSTSTLIDMVTAKATYKFTKWLDTAAYYRIVSDRGSHVIKQAPALEVGIIFFKQFRLGLGYNLLDYRDRTASDENYSGNGPYVNLSAKF